MRVIESDAEMQAVQAEYQAWRDEYGHKAFDSGTARHLFWAGWLAGRDHEREARGQEVERLRAALAGLAMRNFVHDRSWCWCDGVVYDPLTHEHETECANARAALASQPAPAAGEGER